MRNPGIIKLMNYIDNAYHDNPEIVESILNEYNASEDDSGEEGYFATMSDKDIVAAYNKIIASLPYENETEYKDAVSKILDMGFEEKYVETYSGSVSYYVKGDVGILISNVRDIENAAKSII